MISPELLRRFPHFAHFSDDCMKELVMCCALVSFQAEDWIWLEGNQATHLCMLLSGEVHVAYRVGNGDLAVSDTIAPGEAFAWSSMLAPYSLTANCVGSKGGEYIAIDAHELREICSRESYGAYHLIMEIAKTMRERINGLRFQIAANTPKLILAKA